MPPEIYAKVAGSKPGFLKELYTLTCTFPSGIMADACSMWLSLSHSTVFSDSGNISTILDFLLATAGEAKDEEVSVCKEVALVLYEENKEAVANALAAPLHFGNQRDPIRVRSAIVLLAQLSRSDIKPLLPHLASTVNFALLSFPNDEKRKGEAPLFMDGSVRLLLHNLLASLRPHLLSVRPCMSMQCRCKSRSVEECGDVLLIMNTASFR